MSAQSEGRVGVAFAGTVYASTPPYHPARAYPEYPFREVGTEENPAYDALRQLFEQLGYDAEHRGTAQWNPLGHLVLPGNTVVLKPNFVVSRHAKGGELFAAITHPSVLRAIADYVHIALQGRGRIVIADSPQMDCNWEELMAATRLDLVRDFYASHTSVPLDIIDLRDFAMIDANDLAYSTNRKPLPGDPLGEIVFDLGDRSHFAGLGGEDNFYGADFDRSETIRNHSGGVHRYGLSRTIMSADVVISVPKLKVHKKVGVTLNVKGLVGMTTKKNYLVHYRLGSPSRGGDQLPDGLPQGDRLLVKSQRFLFDRLLARQSAVGDLLYQGVKLAYRVLAKPFIKPSAQANQFDGGNWHGNDTAWRMALDLLKIFLYGGTDGQLHDQVQRKVLCVVDGIVGGENDGPLFPDARPAGCLIGGSNPIAVDLVATRVMGFDPARVAQFSGLRDARGFRFGIRDESDIEIRAESERVRDLLRTGASLFFFRPHAGWLDFVELARTTGSELPRTTSEVAAEA